MLYERDQFISQDSVLSPFKKENLVILLQAFNQLMYVKCLAQHLTQSKYLLWGIIFVVLDTDFIVKKQQASEPTSNQEAC